MGPGRAQRGPGGGGGGCDQMSHQFIGCLIHVDTMAILVQIARDVPKLDTDFCSLGVQCFSSLQQERHAIPSGIVNEAGHSCKCRADAA